MVSPFFYVNQPGFFFVCLWVDYLRGYPKRSYGQSVLPGDSRSKWFILSHWLCLPRRRFGAAFMGTWFWMLEFFIVHGLAESTSHICTSCTFMQLERYMAYNLTSDQTHPLHPNFKLLPLGRRYSVPHVRKTACQRFFLPAVIIVLTKRHRDISYNLFQRNCII